MRSRQRVPHVQRRVGSGETLELLAIDQVLERLRGVQQPNGRPVARGRAVADHRHQRHYAGSAGDEQERTLTRRTPHEESADRTSKLDLVSRAQLSDEIRRNLAVVEPLDSDGDAPVLGRGSDRIAPLRLVSVLGGEADVDVLAGEMPWPVGHVDGYARHLRSLGGDLGDLADLPA